MENSGGNHSRDRLRSAILATTFVGALLLLIPLSRMQWYPPPARSQLPERGVTIRTATQPRTGSQSTALIARPPAPRVVTRAVPEPNAQVARPEPESTSAQQDLVDSPPVATAMPDVQSGIIRPTRSSVAVEEASKPGTGIAGRAFLNGRPPPEKPLPLDPACGKLYTESRPMTRFYAVAPDGGLADVFVMIDRDVSRPNATLRPAVNPPPVILDQVGCLFTPYVFGLQVKQKLLVRNSDPLMHNVHVIREGSTKSAINTAMIAGAPDIEVTIGNPEMFLRFKCDVHPWMFAYACVATHSYFSVTDANGNFQIPDLPPGRYLVKASHRRAANGNPRSATVQVVKDKVTTINFAFTVEGDSLDKARAN